MNREYSYKLRDEAAPEHVDVISASVEYRGGIFDISDDRIRFNSGDVVQRQYMKHDDAVAIVPIRRRENDWEVLLIRQYRHAPRRIFWEIPAGLRDVDGESPLKCAQRELKEETGLAASDWRKLVSFYTSPGCSDENLEIFVAVDPVEADVEQAFHAEAEEREIVTQWFALRDVHDAILRSDLQSPTLVLGILAVKSLLIQGLESLDKA
ncbi:ADP-ribose pyrophosphatase [Arcanobacterium pluranimalium]|uniref:NUDIX domain-containing protein n=1 Tax=Arcanobacterium pluranimalium TaxID=108028 RepID=UPI00195EB8A4|nr:NUDIX hydrolase [Arcanobacterium pluranimalium]MBM7825332.1 ADP-ribose pyrophosphatase [Arcanobacterium pluranimalium]